MFRKFAFIAAVLACPLSYAKVIELNNMSAALCQQQLTHAVSDSGSPTEPVVLMYLKGHQGSEEFKSMYEDVSNQYPNRTFFSYEFSDSNPMVAHYCFGVDPWVSPQVYVFNVTISFKPEVPGRVNGVEKTNLAIYTKQDLLNLLNVNNASAKFTYATLKKNNV